ncbi:MAG: AAA family ATPase [Planctomycetota bacterium]
MEPSLLLRGASENNLKAVDLDLPLGQWISVVGPSGSGKTSLVFDVLVREGQRRFLGALSARARHFYGKLGRAAVERLDGLPPAIAVGQQAESANARSTVGTRTGSLDLLRLLFARRGEDPGRVALTRSHFSFNHPDGACEACAGLGVEDRVAPELLIADPARTIRGGALRPTLKNGYTVYSQVTVDVMDRICRAHGFDVDTPWGELADEQRDVVMYGTRKLKVPFGKHPIESRMRWEGITARPREEGYYRGLIPVIEETLKRNRNPNVLRFVRSVACAECGGSRLARAGREARIGGRRLPELLALPAATLRAALDELPPSEVLDALRPSLARRLERMERLGLGHLSLDRASDTLSGGEAQRLRLAAQLTAGLGRMLVALDEPTLGLHPSGQEGMRTILDELRALGNTLLVVEHDPDLVRQADHLVRLGPGAGTSGGEVVESGALAAGADDPLGRAPERKQAPRSGGGVLALRGATLHNLQGADLLVRLGALNVVVGPSGAGKSSLVFGTLLPALRAEPGGPFDALEGAPAAGVEAVDARPIGRTPRSTPATWSGLFDLVRRRFAAEPEAVQRGFKAGRFSYNNKEGRCPACEGLGFRRVGLHLLEDVELDCDACGGGRYAPETLAVRVRGLNIAEVLALTVREACEYFAGDAPLEALVRAMDELGLGYLCLGHASNRLSRGEAQRVKLATLLGTRDASPSLLLLDEPDRGLHPGDVALLLRALDALVDAGHTVVAISHHRHLWAAADVVTELEAGRARDAVEPDLAPLGPVRGARELPEPPPAIRLRGVRTHNLAGVDVDVPHGRWTAIAGVSGSGKSSLAFDTLAAEAWHRFSESLPFQVRRYVRRQPRPPLESAAGLGPTLALRQGQARAGERSTVATQSELGPLLRLLYSRAGTLADAPCGLSAAHFSTEQSLGACPACEGRGVVARCDPDLLVTDPSLPVAGGALSGTRPGRFFSEPDGQHVATLRAALGPDADLGRPWAELDDETRRIALHGAGDAVFDVRWDFQRGQRSGRHEFRGPWEGLCALVEREARRRAGAKSADEWRAPLVDVACAACGGGGLAPDPAAVVVGGRTLGELQALPLAAVLPALEAVEVEPWQRAVLDALLPELRGRLDDLAALGLGHLSLGRRSRTLSEGELQRTRIASVLRAGLTGVTYVLDEPAAGLHARDVERLLERLARLRDGGNTLVVVSHRPEVLRAADHLIELGPGAGAEGGRVAAAGPPAEVLAGDGPTARALRAGAALAPQAPPPTRERLRNRGARAHNLRAIDVELPSAGFVCVTGVSGSGKSSLLFGVLEASARAGRPVGCDGIERVGEDGAVRPGWGLEDLGEVRSSRRLGAGGSMLSALGLLGPLQSLYHAQAKRDPELGLTRAAFSFQSPAGRCETCRGTGREDVAMDFMADLALPCPACGGRRYRDAVLAVAWEGLSVADFLERPAGELPELPKGKLRTGVEALVEIGLGYLPLGRRRRELSGGEAQRVALAAGTLGSPAPSLYLLDEPSTGLHEADLVRLVSVVRRLVSRGNLIVAAEHRASLIGAGDLVLELGPGSGADGGRLVTRG